jgi:hypothetical protein
VEWDLVVFDEYHFGAWRETAKELFEGEEEAVAFAGIVRGELPLGALLVGVRPVENLFLDELPRSERLEGSPREVER